MLSLICGIFKNKTNVFNKTNRLTDTENKPVATSGERGRGTGKTGEEDEEAPSQ